MARIYLPTYSTQDDIYKTVLSEFTKGLLSYGHTITTVDYWQYQGDVTGYSQDISDALIECDIIITVIPRLDNVPDYFDNEIIKNQNYAEKVKKSMIYLYFPDVNLGALVKKFPGINETNSVVLRSTSMPDILDTSKILNQKIQEFLGVKLANDEEAIKAKKQIDASAESFVSKTKTDLKSRENSLKTTALICYGLGLIAILTGIYLVFEFAANGLKIQNETFILSKLKGFDKAQANDLINSIGEKQVNWSLTTYFGIKSILILTLLIAASKYCFNLAKAFMIESLKVADRSHAISFGQFYLEVFNKGIEPSELREVFSDWNISNQNTAFNSQKTDDFDPKYFEEAIELMGKVKEVIKKE